MLFRSQEQQGNLGKVIAKAWADPAFKERLKGNPKRVLTEMGVETPEGVEIEVMENTAEKTYLTLPTPPLREFLSYEEIDMVSSSGRAMPLSPLTPGCGPTNNCC